MAASMATEESIKMERKKEVETTILDMVGQAVTSIKEAKHADQVISSLYSLALLFFPVDPHSFLATIDERYRDQVLRLEVPDTDRRSERWQIFYRGAAFPAFARVLLYDVASSWLACFPTSARKHVYDVFFVSGHATEVVQMIVPCLQHSGNPSHDFNAVCSNAERLLPLCLVENDGVLQMAKEFAVSSKTEKITHEQLKLVISRVAQLITSIPDRARAGAAKFFSAHLFFKHITIQLLGISEVWDLCNEEACVGKGNGYAPVMFVGEVFARICRRGSADVLLNEVAPKILGRVRCVLSMTDVNFSEVFETKSELQFWSRITEAIKDQYSIERMSEQLLRQLEVERASDIEAYWVLWILFHRTLQQPSTRSMFIEKFVLWKVFPLCCLRWIIHFAILECIPGTRLESKAHKARGLLDTVQRVVAAWSKREFVQSASIEHQAYVTAALGLCLEKMSREDLNAVKDAVHLILQGVSCRLESPVHLVRKMTSSVALVFSRVIDPQNPLYLDDSCREESIDWEFGLATSKEVSMPMTHHADKDANKLEGNSIKLDGNEVMGNNVEHSKKSSFVFELVDPDEVIDPASLVNESALNENEDVNNESDDSDASSDSSLQPYDLSDDVTDLERKFSQLADVVGALRKPDDVDGVEKALDVSEKLVRASPDELKYIAGDLTRCLIQVRCSDSSIEGEEESAEEKRQKALVALLVTCPLESVDVVNKLLYSPNLDVSQRILILDVMTEAAHELADTRMLKLSNRPKSLISSVSNQAWFTPKSLGPPGAGPWKEISTSGTPLNLSYSYERELPARPGQIRKGKTRRWSLRSPSQENQQEWSQNKFPQYAAAFMLPAMQGFDKKRQGVDLLGRDFIVLGKLIHMLGVCMKCAAMHPEASALATPLLDMLSSREISQHAEAYVRRSVLFAASCILVALHPSYVASALIEGNTEISRGLEWIRIWALQVAESDTDRDCYTLAMTCLQLHSEMALQASRALESVENSKSSIGLPSDVTRGTIRIPQKNISF